MKKVNFNFNEFSEKLKSLNPKEIYAWPMPFQMGIGALVFVGVFAAGTIFDLVPYGDELQASIDKEEQLKKDFVEKKKQAINLSLYKVQLEEITKDSDALLKQLPNKSQIEQLIIDVNQAGIGRGLQFELFKPGAEKINEFYAELPIQIKVNGTYDAIGNFTADVSQLSRVVIFSDMDISTKNGTVTLTAVAKTFRYLDQAELDAQAAKKKEEEKKKKKAASKDAEKK